MLQESLSSSILSSTKQRNEIISSISSRLTHFTYNYVVSYNDSYSVLLGSSLSLYQDKVSMTMDRKIDPKSMEEIHLLSLVPSIPLPDDFKVVLLSSGVTNENFDQVFDYYDIFQWQFPDSIQCLVCLYFQNLTVPQKQRLVTYKNIIIVLNSEEINQERYDINQRKQRLLSNAIISQLESNVPGEDRYCARVLAEDMKLFTVIDGHGGYLAADITSNFLLDKIISKLLENGFMSCTKEKVYDIIKSTFIEVDDMILNQTTQLVNFPTMNIMPGMTKKPIFQLAGCCVVVALVLGKNLFIAHVGDCRAITFSKTPEESLMSSMEEIFDASYPFRFPKPTKESNQADNLSKKDVNNLTSTALLRTNSTSNLPSLVNPNPGEVENKFIGEISPTSVSDVHTPTGTMTLIHKTAVDMLGSEEDVISDNLSTQEESSILVEESFAGRSPRVSLQTLTSSRAQPKSQLSTEMNDDSGKRNNKDNDTSLHLLADNRNTYLYAVESDNNSSNNSSSNDDTMKQFIHKRPKLRDPYIVPANPMWKDIGGDFYRYEEDGFQLSCVTVDHNCIVPEEREMVTYLSSDPRPLRPSEMGLKNYGLLAPDRVAGSLAITRALGDGYLKRKDISMGLYKDYVPYISSVPTIFHREILDTDIAIVLASDGLWNHVSAKECFNILKSSYIQSTAAMNIDSTNIPDTMDSGEIQIDYYRNEYLHHKVRKMYGQQYENKRGFLCLDSHFPQQNFDYLYHGSNSGPMSTTSSSTLSSSPSSSPSSSSSSSLPLSLSLTSMSSLRQLSIARPYPMPFMPKNEPLFPTITKNLFTVDETPSIEMYDNVRERSNELDKFSQTYPHSSDHTTKGSLSPRLALLNVMDSLTKRRASISSLTFSPSSGSVSLPSSTLSSNSASLNSTIIGSPRGRSGIGGLASPKGIAELPRRRTAAVATLRAISSSASSLSKSVSTIASSMTTSLSTSTISNETIAQEKYRLVSEKLLKQCLLNASINAGINVSSPSCDFSFQSHRWKHRRDVIDDVTIVVIPLNDHPIL